LPLRVWKEVEELSWGGKVTAVELAGALRRYRFHYWKESVLQEAIETLLKVEDLEYSREMRLGPRARIDFLVEGVGLEVKTAGSADSVLRQLTRYAGFDAIEGLVLVTNKLRHTFPSEVGGKPLEIVRLTLHSL
jgi:hypothetical protein